MKSLRLALKIPPGYDPHHAGCKDSVNETAGPVWKASRSPAAPSHERLLPHVGVAETRPRTRPKRSQKMSVAIFVVLTIALFAMLGLIQKAVERL
ncbi:hypothetical protein ABIA30_002515 [Mycobacterium sp. MAA66]